MEINNSLRKFNRNLNKQEKESAYVKIGLFTLTSLNTRKKKQENTNIPTAYHTCTSDLQKDRSVRKEQSI